MKNATYAKLVEAMEEIINLENSARDGVVYESLAGNMADVAEIVYDACLKGQSYAKDETETTT